MRNTYFYLLFFIVLTGCNRSESLSTKAVTTEVSSSISAHQLFAESKTAFKRSSIPIAISGAIELIKPNPYDRLITGRLSKEEILAFLCGPNFNCESMEDSDWETFSCTSSFSLPSKQYTALVYKFTSNMGANYVLNTYSPQEKLISSVEIAKYVEDGTHSEYKNVMINQHGSIKIETGNVATDAQGTILKNEKGEVISENTGRKTYVIRDTGEIMEKN